MYTCIHVIHMEVPNMTFHHFVHKPSHGYLLIVHLQIYVMTSFWQSAQCLISWQHLLVDTCTHLVSSRTSMCIHAYALVCLTSVTMRTCHKCQPSPQHVMFLSYLHKDMLWNCIWTAYEPRICRLLQRLQMQTPAGVLPWHFALLCMLLQGTPQFCLFYILLLYISIQIKFYMGITLLLARYPPSALINFIHGM